MDIITSDAELRHYIPNTFASVSGETALYDKMVPRLRAAELWFTQRITPLDELYALQDGSPVLTVAIPETVVPTIIVCEAFRHSVDSLNVVLTSNGFGIVSNDHIAPASKERTDRLKDELKTQRDAAIARLLTALEPLNEWKEMRGWWKFHETLDNYHSDYLNHVPFEDWESSQGITLVVENSLADKYISRPLYELLRAHVSPADSHLRSLRRCLLSVEKNIIAGQNQDKVLRSLVNHIRTATEADGVTLSPCFNCWRESPVAALWQDHSYKNDPKRGGVWL